jgi:hypothetical protein
MRRDPFRGHGSARTQGPVVVEGRLSSFRNLPKRFARATGGLATDLSAPAHELAFVKDSDSLCEVDPLGVIQESQHDGPKLPASIWPKDWEDDEPSRIRRNAYPQLCNAFLSLAGSKGMVKSALLIDVATVRVGVF